MNAEQMPTGKRDQLAQLAAMFGQPEAEAHKDAAARALQRYRDAYDAMNAEAKEAELKVHGTSTLARMFYAGHRLAEVWERRAKATERALRAVLASDCVTDDQRAAILAVMNGKAPARDPKLLTEMELRMLGDYRAMDAPGRQMLRTLMARLNGRTGRR